MTWNILGMLAAGLIPALALITIIGCVVDAINERRHPDHTPTDEAMYH